MIEVYKIDKEAVLPTRANNLDAGLDLYSNETLYIPIGNTVTISTGVAIHIPPGNVGKIEDRSSLASQGLRTGGGIVDSGYSGEIKVIMHNFSANKSKIYGAGQENSGIWIEAGQKIAQLLVYKVETLPAVETTILWEAPRGSKGFGSSGQ